MAVLSEPSNIYWRFSTDQGDVDYYCYGDCCSDSWINHISGLDELVGGTVREVDNIDFHALLQVEPEATRQEYDEVLFYRVYTEKGVCSFEFRNSSNGYYGGSLERVTEDSWKDYSELTAELAPLKGDY